MAATIALARESRKTSRYIGMMPFVVYAYLRRAHVHILFVDRVVDILEEYAPLLCDRCAKAKPLATAVFCRRMIFKCNGTRHHVAQRLRSDRDVLRGNHWLAGSAAVLAVLVCRHWFNTYVASALRPCPPLSKAIVVSTS